jgi:hypothetical protein
MGFEGLGDLMRSRCLSQETPKPRFATPKLGRFCRTPTEPNIKELHHLCLTIPDPVIKLPRELRWWRPRPPDFATAAVLMRVQTSGRLRPPLMPPEREGHMAIWTGSEMIVWGGVGYYGVLNTGGRYNPSPDSWTLTSLTNAPTRIEMCHRSPAV